MGVYEALEEGAEERQRETYRQRERPTQTERLGERERERDGLGFWVRGLGLWVWGSAPGGAAGCIRCARGLSGPRTSPPHAHSLTHTHAQPLTHSNTLPRSHSHAPPLTHPLTLTLSLSLTHTRSLARSHTQLGLKGRGEAPGGVAGCLQCARGLSGPRTRAARRIRATGEVRGRACVSECVCV